MHVTQLSTFSHGLCRTKNTHTLAIAWNGASAQMDLACDHRMKEKSLLLYASVPEHASCNAILG